jgi:hypothetical protein
MDERHFAIPGASMQSAATKRAFGASGTRPRGACLTCRRPACGGNNMAFGLRRPAAAVEMAIVFLTAVRSDRNRRQQAHGNSRHCDVPQQQHQAPAIAGHRRVLIATARGALEQVHRGGGE